MTTGNDSAPPRPPTEGFFKGIWRRYLGWLSSMNPSIAGAAVMGLTGALTAFVTLAAIVYTEYEGGEKQLVYLHQVMREHQEQLTAYSRLALMIDRFNARYAVRYGRLDPTADVPLLERALGAIRESPSYQGGIDGIMEEFKTTIAEIERRTNKLDRLSRQINRPVVVKSGDTHSRIALKFLEDEIGLPPDVAKETMLRTALVWDLEAGNYVYNVYHDGIFLTTVTQGDAGISPTLAQARIRKRYDDNMKNYQRQIADYEGQLRTYRDVLDRLMQAGQASNGSAGGTG